MKRNEVGFLLMRLNTADRKTPTWRTKTFAYNIFFQNVQKIFVKTHIKTHFVARI